MVIKEQGLSEKTCLSTPPLSPASSAWQVITCYMTRQTWITLLHTKPLQTSLPSPSPARPYSIGTENDSTTSSRLLLLQSLAEPVLFPSVPWYTQPGRATRTGKPSTHFFSYFSKTSIEFCMMQIELIPLPQMPDSWAQSVYCVSLLSLG